MFKESDCGPILAVSFPRKTEKMTWNPKRVVHYRIQINGAPGHNVIELPWYQFSCRPSVGDRLVYLWDASFGGARVVYRVVKTAERRVHG